jgi:DNA helicase IV
MHPDLPNEQAYFDRALALRDRQQAGLARAPRLAANPKAAIELRKRVSKLGLADPDEAIAFGRIDAADDRWYIGKGAIWDDDNDLVVVNWQAPIAAPFYTATPDDPEGLDARRLFRCTGNQIREIEDLVFRDLAEAIASGRQPEPVITDALLDALGSARSGELGDIVATIQAAQYDVISRDLNQLLVVQGGPGTGKTVVGLHRVSWLLFNRRDRIEANDVLIVGPNPAFVHYISSVLPSLGEEAVVQLPLRALGPRVRIGRVDPPELRRLKGDRRMLRLILRGMRNRQRIDAHDVELTIEGRKICLDGRRIATRSRQLAGRPHNQAHRMLRAFLISEARTALNRLGARDAAARDIVVQGEAAKDVDSHLDRVWPSLTPQGFLVELLSSRRQLLAAGAGTLGESELELLALPRDARVGTWQWAVDDVPLLDAADALLNGVSTTYEHIVVDEAQDLSPLQLESIRRRSRTGSMTVLGDLAQATSPWAHQSWDAVVACLRQERVTATPVELEYGYRLPAEVHDVAMRLLPDAAPDLGSPRPVRCSGYEVAVVTSEDEARLADTVVAAVRELLGSGIVGVITPPSVRAALVAALDADGIAWTPELRPAAAPVVVLTPDDAKGLEFDVVVVVEPKTIVDESEHGLRALYVALTRCTSRLALVHARPLPRVLGLGGVVDDEALVGMDEEGDGATLDHTPDRPEVHTPVHPPDEAEVQGGGLGIAAPGDEAAAGGFDLAENEGAAGGSGFGLDEVEGAAGGSGFGLDEVEGPAGGFGLAATEEVEGVAGGFGLAEDEGAAGGSGFGLDEVEGAAGGSGFGLDEAEGGAGGFGLAATEEVEASAGFDVAEDEGAARDSGFALEEVDGAAGSSIARDGGAGEGVAGDSGFGLDEVEGAADGSRLGEHEGGVSGSGFVLDEGAAAPAPEVSATLDALGGLDREIARAIASAVIERLRPLVSPSLLVLVAEELAGAVEAAADETVRGR